MSSTRVVCSADCGTSTSLTRAAAVELGWHMPRGGGFWLCPECAYEWRAEMQAQYDDTWGSPLDMPGGYGS